MSRAKAGGLALTGKGGVLAQLTKRLLESVLEGEITDHLGYDKYDPAGRGTGNSRNGTRAKTVLTDVGPVRIDVPRDRDASFEPSPMTIIRRACHVGVKAMSCPLLTRISSDASTIADAGERFPLRSVFARVFHGSPRLHRRCPAYPRCCGASRRIRGRCGTG
nr:transposase [Amycolatopsis vastitatis]